jgi:hypothetical protein
MPRLISALPHVLRYIVRSEHPRRRASRAPRRACDR